MSNSTSFWALSILCLFGCKHVEVNQKTQHQINEEFCYPRKPYYFYKEEETNFYDFFCGP